MTNLPGINPIDVARTFHIGFNRYMKGLRTGSDCCELIMAQNAGKDFLSPGGFIMPVFNPEGTTFQARYKLLENGNGKGNVSLEIGTKDKTIQLLQQLLPWGQMGGRLVRPLVNELAIRTIDSEKLVNYSAAMYRVASILNQYKDSLIARNDPALSPLPAATGAPHLF